MPVAEPQAGAAQFPVVRRAAIGERFIGAYISHKSRDVLKDGNPVLKANGKHQQELVIHALVMPGTTATVGNAENFAAPAVGDVVRLIVKGRSFAQWIECMDKLKGVQRAGDVVEMTIDQAQQYDANGAPKGQPITDQAAALAVPRGVSLGFYGPLVLRACTPAEMEWITKADEAYATISSGRTADYDDGSEPF